MTATGYMIPFVVAGGILFALTVTLSGQAAVPETGWLAKLNQIGAGFIGGIIAGFIAGYVVMQLKKIKLPPTMRTLGPIFIYSLVGTLVTGVAICVPPIGLGLATLLSPKKFTSEERDSGKATLLMGCLNHTPWGRLIVLPVVDNKLGYLASVLCGAIVVAVVLRFVKKDVIDDGITDEIDEEEEMLELAFEEL